MNKYPPINPVLHDLTMFTTPRQAKNDEVSYKYVVNTDSMLSAKYGPFCS